MSLTSGVKGGAKHGKGADDQYQVQVHLRNCCGACGSSGLGSCCAEGKRFESADNRANFSRDALESILIFLSDRVSDGFADFVEVLAIELGVGLAIDKANLHQDRRLFALVKEREIGFLFGPRSSSWPGNATIPARSICCCEVKARWCSAP
jgi:hypothetical protein